MAKFTGTVQRNDLEGGFWELVASDGNTYQLQGGDPTLRTEGQAVEIDGDVAKDTMGIGMTGPILKVKTWSAR